MINNSVFKISIGESIELLKEIKLFKSLGPNKIGVYSEEFKKVCRRNKHIEIYKTIISNNDYEILLSDDSIFQFAYEDNYLRFSFVQNPRINATKYDYLKNCFPDEDDLDELSEEEINAMIDENEFEQFLNEQEINSNLIYVRYDYDKKGYNPLLHSCSHLHIGLNENFRIPSSIILTPLEFVFFCIKQCYYNTWKLYHEKTFLDEIIKKLHASKKQCLSIKDIKIWDTIEQNEIYIA